MTPAHSRAALLAARREALVSVAQAQRDLLGADALSLGPALRWIERGRNVWLIVRDHPWLVALPVAAVAAFRPRWLLRVGGAAVALWRLNRRMR